MQQNPRTGINKVAARVRAGSRFGRGMEPEWCTERIWQPLTWYPVEKFQGKSDELAPIRVSLVVSYCTASLDWLAPEITKLRNCFSGQLEVETLHIYSKCGRPVPMEGLPPRTFVVELENVGRCDHSYAYHLARTHPPR